jgi:sugar/nucleoside kinase (ribokinase family)
MRSLHIGSAMIDTVTLVAPEDIERASFTNDGKSYLMLETGRKVPAKSITWHVGGGACNTAVSLARRGWRAAVTAKTGDDPAAEEVRRHLDAEGIEARLIEAPGKATGKAVMIASHDRNASIFVHRGANETIRVDELPAAAFRGFDLVYVGPLSNESADCFPHILETAKAAGATVAANPGIRQLTARTAGFLAALRHLDLLNINRVEAEALVPVFAPHAEGPDAVAPRDAPALLRRGLSFGGFEMGLVRFIRAVQAAGPAWVSITDGTDGSYLGTPEGVLWHPTVPAEVQGTAGAGDGFCSTLSAALAEGMEPEAAMREAAVNAASVVEHLDTTSGLLRPDEMRERVARVEVEARRIDG